MLGIKGIILFMPPKIGNSSTAVKPPLTKVALLATSRPLHSKFKKFAKERGQVLQFITEEAIQEYMAHHSRENS